MDGLDEELKQIFSRKSDLPGGISAKDADTMVAPTGQSIRLQGINARETAKFQPGQIKGSQLGADTQTRMMEDLIREGGYTTPVFSGNKSYERDVGDLANAAGNRLTNKALSMGIVEPTTSTDQGQYSSMYMGGLDRAQRRIERKPTVADTLLDTLNKERNAAGFMAKRLTDTASQFGSVVDESGNSDYFAGPAIIRKGEDKFGKATSNLDTGWDQGMLNMSKGLYGSLDMIANKTGSEWLTNKAQSNIRSLNSELADLPELRNGEAFDEKGNWKLDSLGKVVDWTVGNAAASAPQMMATIVATMASPATGGASMLPIAGMYTGQVWNDQKNKNATAAILAGITMTALDKMSLGFLGKSAGLNLTRKATQDVVLKELQKTMTREAAEALVSKSLKESVKEVSDAMAKVTMAKELGLKGIAKATGEGIVSEGVTEGAQELTGYFGEQGGIGLPTSPEEMQKLKSRVMNATAGGAMLGGVLSGSGRTVAALTQNKNLIDTTTDVQYREKYLAELSDKAILSGKSVPLSMPSTHEVINDAIKSQLTNENETTLENLSQPEVIKRSTENITAKAGSWFRDKGFQSLHGKFSDIIMGDNTFKSIYSAALATVLGSSKALNGASIDEHHAITEANIFKNFGVGEDLSAAFGGVSTQAASAILSNPTVVDAIKELARIKRDLFSKSTHDIADKINIDYGKFGEYKNSIIEYADRISNLVTSYNEATGKKMDVADFIQHKPLDKTIVSKNSGQFIKDLQDHLGMDHKDAQLLTNSILNNDSINSMVDSLDEFINDDAQKLKSKGELEVKLSDPKLQSMFAGYMSHNLIDNAYSLSASAAAYNTNKELIGKNGSKLAALVQQMLDNGDIDTKQAGFMAKEIRDTLDIRNGKYHPINNPYLKGAINTVNFLSTIVSLPLAAVSSTVEFAQIYRNLNRPQSIKATKALLTSTGSEIGALYREIGNKFSDKVLIKKSKTRSALSEAGYMREGGVGHRNDVLTSYYQKWTDGFFKVTGLTSVTAITRNARLAIAADAIQNWLDTVSTGNNESQDVIDAKDHLTRIGVDYQYILNIDADTSSTEKRVVENLQRATYNFVNEAVVIPTTLNRPKFYSDPYLRLFTTFQGYTSAFTANILPRLIGDLGRKGSDDQKNAAAVIAMMIALSMLALYIKDMIKYNKHPPEWVKDNKEFLRVINQTGLLGSGQRVFDQIFPVLEDNKTKSIYDRIAEQSPQLSYLNKIEKVLAAPQGKQIEQGAKLLPLFGTSPAFAKYLQRELGGS